MASPSADDVLDVAEQLLVDDGPEALSMRRLAAALGTSYQVVYSRVGDKAKLVRALHDRGFDRLTRSAADTLSLEDETEVLRAMGRSYLSTAEHQPVLFDVMFGVPIPEFVRDDAARGVAREGFRQTWVAACRRWLDVHHPRRKKRSAVRLAWRLWTAVHGITVLHLAGHESPSGDAEREVERTIELLLVDPLA